MDLYTPCICWFVFWLALNMLASFCCLPNTSATYAGIFTMLSYTVCPSILHILGHKLMKEKDLPVHTHYKIFFSPVGWAYGLVALSCLSILAVIVDAAL